MKSKVTHFIGIAHLLVYRRISEEGDEEYRKPNQRPKMHSVTTEIAVYTE